MDNKKRCSWLNLKNEDYVKYHDEEWGILTKTSDRYLFEILSLEIFQTGLSFEIVLNKRKDLKKAYEDFDFKKIKKYKEKNINALMNNPKIIRNKLKIEAIIENSKNMDRILNDYGSLYNFVLESTKNFKKDEDKETMIKNMCKDFKKYGFKFIGFSVTKSFLEALGLINSHEDGCFLSEKNK